MIDVEKIDGGKTRLILESLAEFEVEKFKNGVAQIKDLTKIFLTALNFRGVTDREKYFEEILKVARAEKMPIGEIRIAFSIALEMKFKRGQQREKMQRLFESVEKRLN